MKLPSAITVSPEWRQKLIDAGFPESELVIGCSEEILRRLPRQISPEDTKCYCYLAIEPMNMNERTWSVGYLNIRETPMVKWEMKYDPSLANAAAAMWCYLKSCNLLPQLP